MKTVKKIDDKKLIKTISRNQQIVNKFYSEIINLFDKHAAEINMKLFAIDSLNDRWPYYREDSVFVINFYLIQEAEDRYVDFHNGNRGILKLPKMLWKFHFVNEIKTLGEVLTSRPKVYMSLLRPKDDKQIKTIFPNIYEDHGICLAGAWNVSLKNYKGKMSKVNPEIIFQDMVMMPSIYWDSQFNNDYAPEESVLQWLADHYNIDISKESYHYSEPSCSCCESTSYYEPDIMAICDELLYKDIDWNLAPEDEDLYIKIPGEMKIQEMLELLK